MPLDQLHTAFQAIILNLVHTVQFLPHGVDQWNLSKTISVAASATGKAIEEFCAGAYRYMVSKCVM